MTPFTRSTHYFTMPLSKRFTNPISILTSLTIALLLYLYNHHKLLISRDSTLEVTDWNPIRQQSDICVSKATILYPPSDVIYTRSLTLHSQHNDRFGYEMHVLRTPIVRGYANTLLWVQHVIVGEIMKKEKRDGSEWILYVPKIFLL